MNIRVFCIFGCMVTFFSLPLSVSAHRSGCHNLHTCPSDSDTYVCGDLGYPCDGSSSIVNVDSSNIFVPLVTEKMFLEIFGRKPSYEESEYWKKRFRSDKDSIYKLRPAMLWHKNKGSAGPASVMQSNKINMAQEIPAMFASVYDGRLPTPSERKYWLSRIIDKKTPPAMVGAMNYHKTHALVH